MESSGPCPFILLNISEIALLYCRLCLPDRAGCSNSMLTKAFVEVEMHVGFSVNASYCSVAAKLKPILCRSNMICATPNALPRRQTRWWLSAPRSAPLGFSEYANKLHHTSLYACSLEGRFSFFGCTSLMTRQLFSYLEMLQFKKDEEELEKAVEDNGEAQVEKQTGQ